MSCLLVVACSVQDGFEETCAGGVAKGAFRWAAPSVLLPWGGLKNAIVLCPQLGVRVYVDASRLRLVLSPCFQLIGYLC